MLHILSHYISCTRLPTQSEQCQKSNSSVGFESIANYEGCCAFLSRCLFYVLIFFSKWKYKRIPWFSMASMKNIRLCILNIEIWIHFAISSQHAIPKSAIYRSFFLPLVCIYLSFCLQLSIASWIKYTLLMALVGKICLLGVTNILFHCRLHSLNTANESVVLVLNVLARMQTSNC